MAHNRSQMSVKLVPPAREPRALHARHRPFSARRNSAASAPLVACIGCAVRNILLVQSRLCGLEVIGIVKILFFGLVTNGFQFRQLLFQLGMRYLTNYRLERRIITFLCY